MANNEDDALESGENIDRIRTGQIEGRTVVVAGKWIKIASIKDEPFVEGDVVDDPATFVKTIAASGLKADILTFPQKIYETTLKYNYMVEWDNAAVISTTDYNDWWENKLPQEGRKNVRRAAKRGVSVQCVKFDDELVRGIKGVYDEAPFRQGRRFWHYGKDFETVKKENATYLDRSEFIGAYHQGELIGFIKFVRVNQTARLMQILAKTAHHDKRPMNALLNKAVEVCHQEGLRYLVYSKFNFGNKKKSQLTEFKHRNGFEELRFPKYYIPLTLKGSIALKLKLHRSLLDLLPSSIISILWSTRARLIRFMPKAIGSDSISAGKTSAEAGTTASAD